MDINCRVANNTGWHHFIETLSKLLARCGRKSTGHQWFPSIKGQWRRSIKCENGKGAIGTGVIPFIRVWSLLVRRNHLAKLLEEMQIKTNTGITMHPLPDFLRCRFSLADDDLIPHIEWYGYFWQHYEFFTLGLYSLSGKTSYGKISWSLEAARFGFRLFQSLWNLTGTPAACQISERCDYYNTQSRGFETSRDLAVRRLTT